MSKTFVVLESAKMGDSALLITAITQNDTTLLTNAIKHYADNDKTRSGGVDADLIAEGLVMCCKLGGRNECLDLLVKLSRQDSGIYFEVISEIVRAIKKYDN